MDITGGPNIVSASANARKNGVSNLLTASYSATGSVHFASLTSLQNNTFVAGDYLEMMLVGTTGSVTQVCIQVDFLR